MHVGICMSLTVGLAKALTGLCHEYDNVTCELHRSAVPESVPVKSYKVVVERKQTVAKCKGWSFPSCRMPIG